MSRNVLGARARRLIVAAPGGKPLVSDREQNRSLTVAALIIPGHLTHPLTCIILFALFGVASCNQSMPPDAANMNATNTNENTAPDMTANDNAMESPFAEIVGTFHLSGTREAGNLLIRVDGSFDYDGNSCLATTQSNGRVAANDIFMTLVSAVGAGVAIMFPCDVSEDGASPVMCSTSGVLVSRAEDGGLTTIVNGVPQSWAEGRVCSLCAVNGSPEASGFEPCECSTAVLSDVPACP